MYSSLCGVLGGYGSSTVAGRANACLGTSTTFLITIADAFLNGAFNILRDFLPYTLGVIAFMIILGLLWKLVSVIRRA